MTAQDDDILCSRGITFPNDPAVLTPRLCAALTRNSYERLEYRAAMSVACEQDRVLELGGGLGLLSTALAVSSKVRSVVTLDANPDLVTYIENVHRMNQVEIARVINGVAGPEGVESIPFYIRQNILASSLDPDMGRKPVATIPTPVHDLNGLIREHEISYLICDIEGGEADLIAMLEPAPTLRAVTVELHPRKISAEGIKLIFDHMHDMGLIYAPESSFGAVVSFVRPETG